MYVFVDVYNGLCKVMLEPLFAHWPAVSVRCGSIHVRTNKILLVMYVFVDVYNGLCKVMSEPLFEHWPAVSVRCGSIHVRPSGASYHHCAWRTSGCACHSVQPLVWRRLSRGENKNWATHLITKCVCVCVCVCEFIVTDISFTVVVLPRPAEYFQAFQVCNQATFHRVQLVWLVVEYGCTKCCSWLLVEYECIRCCPWLVVEYECIQCCPWLVVEYECIQCCPWLVVENKCTRCWPWLLVEYECIRCCPWLLVEYECNRCCPW